MTRAAASTLAKLERSAERAAARLDALKGRIESERTFLRGAHKRLTRDADAVARVAHILEGEHRHASRLSRIAGELRELAADILADAGGAADGYR